MSFPLGSEKIGRCGLKPLGRSYYGFMWGVILNVRVNVPKRLRDSVRLMWLRIGSFLEVCLVRGRHRARDSSYKTQMVEAECCIGPWVEETFAGILIVRGFADERDFTDD